MAIAATMVGEVRTGGADTNGGFFKTGASGTDYSVQNGFQFNGTNLTVDPTTNTKVTPDGHTPAAADVGNTVYIASGTGWTVGLYEITAQDGVEWTLDRSPALVGVTGGVWAMGGAKASPGGFGRDHVAGNDGWAAGGTYTVTSATANVAAGCVTMAGGASAANGQRFEGYASSRGDKGAYTIIKSDGIITTFTLVTLANNCTIENIEADGNSRTSSRGVNGAFNSLAFRVRGKNCTNNAFNGTAANGLFDLCEATLCSTQPAFSVLYASRSDAYLNTVTGFSGGAVAVYRGCTSTNNSGASSDGFACTSMALVDGLTGYGNGRDGIRFTAANGIVSRISNSIMESNVGVGFNATAAFDSLYMASCAYYNNGTNVAANVTAANNVGGILGTSSFFTNAAGNDFSLNNTATGGALARAKGIPTASGTYALPGLSTASYPDAGAAQHSDKTVGGARSDFLAIGIR